MQDKLKNVEIQVMGTNNERGSNLYLVVVLILSITSLNVLVIHHNSFILSISNCLQNAKEHMLCMLQKEVSWGYTSAQLL